MDDVSLHETLSELLDRVEVTLLLDLHRKLNLIMADLSTLQAAVARVKTVEDSAIALLQGLKQQLDAAIASNDPAALQALSDQLGQDSDALAAAVTQNTPAANTPAAPPATP